jgi:hypothetical protein
MRGRKRNVLVQKNFEGVQRQRGMFFPRIYLLLSQIKAISAI